MNNIVEIRDLNNTSIGDNLVNDRSKKFHIQFNYLDENNNEKSIPGKNWDPDKESETFNFFADRVDDGAKCSYINEEDFIIRLSGVRYQW